MKLLLVLLLFFAGSALAQPVRILDTLTDGQGRKINQTISITWAAFTSGSTPVPAGSVLASVVDGRLDVSLMPNFGTGVPFVVRFPLPVCTETWYVPSSTVALGVSSIRPSGSTVCVNAVTGGGSGAVASVFGRTGAIAALAPDYAAHYAALVAGVVAPSQLGASPGAGKFLDGLGVFRVVDAADLTGVLDLARIPAVLTGKQAGTAAALAANPTNCPAGQAAAGVDASGAAEGCFTPAGGSGAVDSVFGRTGVVTAQAADYAAHYAALVSGVVAPSQLGSSPGAGKFLDGLGVFRVVDIASTATALAANPTNCPAGQAAAGVDAAGSAEGCFTPAGGGGTNYQTVRIGTGADLAQRPRLRFDAATGAICTGQDVPGTTETVVTCGPDALRTVLRMTIAERATLVPSPVSGTTVVISDGTSATDCTTGGNPSGFSVLCRYSGATWVAQGGGGGGSAPAWERSTITSVCDTNFSGAGLSPGIIVPGNPSAVCGVQAGGTSPEGRYSGARLSDFDHNGGVLIWAVGRLPTGLNLASATVWLSTMQPTLAQNPNSNTLNIETRCLVYPYLGAATAGGWNTASTVAISTPTVDQVRVYEVTGVALGTCAAGRELQVRVRFTGGAWFGNEDVHEIGITIPRA